MKNERLLSMKDREGLMEALARVRAVEVIVEAMALGLVCSVRSPEVTAAQNAEKFLVSMFAFSGLDETNSIDALTVRFLNSFTERLRRRAELIVDEPRSPASRN